MWKSFDTKSWGRRKAFEFYRQFDDPHFNFTANVDITNLLINSKTENHSFFLATLHTAVKVVNTIDNFKMRFDGKDVKLYDIVHGGSTLFYDDESFGFGYYDFCDDRTEFIKNAQIIIDKAKAEKSFNPSQTREDLIYFTSMPWVSFTSLKHAQDRSINPAIPRISFGKYFKQNDKYLMPVNVEVNHAMMDGYHVGLFFERFEKLCCE